MTTLSLNLNQKETAALEELCARQDLNKTQLLRQAFRLYQHVQIRASKGERLAFVDSKGNVVRQEIIGIGIVE